MKSPASARHSIAVRLGAVLVALGMTALLAGCGSGDTGPKRYQLSGKAEFNGQPIPAGQIVFEPDSSKGNSGPQGAAEIRDGKFDTRNGGRGTIGGPHRVRINGYDGVSQDEMHPAKSLFPEYTTTVDLPKEDGTHDFSVPAAKGKK
jgi:hypothetical protein